MPFDALSGYESVEIFETPPTAVKYGKTGASDVANGIELSLPVCTCSSNHSVFIMTQVLSYTIAMLQDGDDEYTDYKISATFDTRTVACPANETTCILSTGLSGHNSLHLCTITTSNSLQFVAYLTDIFPRSYFNVMINAQFVAI